jgi:hypothetical protein
LRVWSTWRWHTWVYRLWRRSRSNGCSKQNVTIRYSDSKNLQCHTAKPDNICLSQFSSIVMCLQTMPLVKG